ncbi:hemagglutinin repeat-containing protein [Caballeronia sp. dw_19]|uniref:hemagglutinin repeat-containing protein n=1 Tax=Caballeronia sp. dw_19 TaxID=2719791 RepID=UPI001BD30C9A|nr:hemagglutinin repeat-containing protein [Caballeronia sp. dw_19]
MFTGDNATGSLVSGDSVAIGAGHDINVRGSAVVGTDVVALQAGHDVNITTSQSTDTQGSAALLKIKSFDNGYKKARESYKVKDDDQDKQQ